MALKMINNLSLYIALDLLQSIHSINYAADMLHQYMKSNDTFKLWREMNRTFDHKISSITQIFFLITFLSTETYECTYLKLNCETRYLISIVCNNMCINCEQYMPIFLILPQMSYPCRV